MGFKKEERDMHEIVDELLADGGPLTKYIPNYKKRDSQVEAIHEALKSLAEGKTFVFEGATGIGKSAAYIIASLIFTLNSDDRCVIATAGITLQEQIYYKDLPNIIHAIRDVTGKEVFYAHIKGRANYICKRKLSDVEFELKQTSYVDKKEEKAKIIAWADISPRGDNSELSYVPDSDVWRQFSCTDGNDCQGRQCDYYSQCFYQRVKERAKTAHIVVCNYHILFSDIILPKDDDGNGRMLGSYSVLVCDEGHEIAKIARDFQEVKLSYYTFVNMQKNLTRLQRDFPGMCNTNIVGIDDLLSFVKGYLQSLQKVIAFKANDDNIKLINGMRLPFEEFGMKKAITDFVSTVVQCREDVVPYDMEYLFFSPDGGETESEQKERQGKAKICKVLDNMIEDANMSTEAFEMICYQEDKSMTYWVEMSKSNNLLSLHTKPVRVAEFLKNTVFSNPEITTIITSATLAVNGNFNYIKTELGIENANEMIATSPFDLKNQELWYLPPNAVEGNLRDTFNDQAMRDTVEIVDACQGGVLCLCTSNFNMNFMAKNLKRAFPRMTILKQGDNPRGMLLDMFAKDRHSVLVGTKSFFTGIDIKGDSLRCVIIDKLPFESPNDPVMSILSAEKSGFFKYSIPAMVIALKQAVGRGIRDMNDKCVIAILDNRMATARYKNQITSSFNYEKTGTRDLNDVGMFIKKYLKGRDIDE